MRFMSRICSNSSSFAFNSPVGSSGWVDSVRFDVERLSRLRKLLRLEDSIPATHPMTTYEQIGLLDRAEAPCETFENLQIT